jgi:hypothetical protein
MLQRGMTWTVPMRADSTSALAALDALRLFDAALGLALERVDLGRVREEQVQVLDAARARPSRPRARRRSGSVSSRSRPRPAYAHGAHLEHTAAAERAELSCGGGGGEEREEAREVAEEEGAEHGRDGRDQCGHD